MWLYRPRNLENVTYERFDSIVKAPIREKKNPPILWWPDTVPPARAFKEVLITQLLPVCVSGSRGELIPISAAKIRKFFLLLSNKTIGKHILFLYRIRQTYLVKLSREYVHRINSAKLSQYKFFKDE